MTSIIYNTRISIIFLIIRVGISFPTVIIVLLLLLRIVFIFTASPLYLKIENIHNVHKLAVFKLFLVYKFRACIMALSKQINPVYLHFLTFTGFSRV